ncbi:PC4-domain-containing protein [Pseudohyphozyma bogoriensis]|nr:PC4-domain-containing protein [Pseudohyphozyma bogoriensis]
MPKFKREDSFIVPSDEEADKPATKKAKKDKKSKKEVSSDDDDDGEIVQGGSGGGGAALKNGDGDAYVELSTGSTARRATVRKFKNSILIDIRETYSKDGKDGLPGKKGISLSREQWEKLKDEMATVGSYSPASCISSEFIADLAVVIDGKEYKLPVPTQPKPWTKEEDELIDTLKLMRDCWDPVVWQGVLDKLPGRTRQEIKLREDELKALHGTSQRRTWTAEDDQLLLELAPTPFGNAWDELALLHFPARTGLALKHRHERLLPRCGRDYTTEQDDFLLALGKPSLVRSHWETIERAFPNRSWRTVYRRLSTLLSPHQSETSEEWERVYRVFSYRTPKSIRNRLDLIVPARKFRTTGLPRNQLVRWTKDEDERLIKFYKANSHKKTGHLRRNSLPEILEELAPRSLATVKSRLVELKKAMKAECHVDVGRERWDRSAFEGTKGTKPLKTEYE